MRHKLSFSRSDIFIVILTIILCMFVGTMNVFAADSDSAYAILYDDGELVLQKGDAPDEGRTVTNIYTGFETTTYTSEPSVPWYRTRGTIKTVTVKDEISPVSTAFWFINFTKLTSANLEKLNVSNVRDMRAMFYGCTSLETLDLSNFITPNLTSTWDMFNRCTKLKYLDISNMDTRQTTTMTYMFGSCGSLETVIFGENFSFKGKNITGTFSQALLPSPPTSTTTGKWIRNDALYGPYTAAEMRSNYGDNASSWAGEWIWQGLETKYKLIFNPGSATGSMFTQEIIAASDGVIDACAFTLFNHHFDHWEASNGSIYENGATIPANTYAAGDVITLTAVFVENENKFTLDDGEFELTLHAWEKATLSDIPAGTAYQVYEETPDGWVLVSQSNTSGTIQPLDTANAEFSNKYQPGTTTVQFSGTKTLDNRPAAADAYEFELLEDGVVLQTVSVLDGGFIQFDAIELTSADAGIHEYQIREVDPQDSAIDYDTHIEIIQVEVADDGNGNVHAEVAYDADGIVFANTTRPGVLRVTKDADGVNEANADTEFTFKVTLTNENGMPIGIDDAIYWYVDGEHLLQAARNAAIDALNGLVQTEANQ